MTSVRAQLDVFRVLFMAGATTFGGMWAATDKLERDLVDRAGWISKEELRTSFVLATLIPRSRRSPSPESPCWSPGATSSC